MTDRTIVEETSDGYKMVAATAIRYRNPDGTFIDRETFVEERNKEIRTTGYGVGSYGAGAFGE